MPDPHFPGVFIQEMPIGMRAIRGVPTSIALFIGWAPRGPIDQAVRLTSFGEYERHYGGLDLRTWLPYALNQFFANGGRDAYVIRIADEPTAATASTVSGGLTFTASSPGAWANAYSIKTTPAPNAHRFHLDVIYETAHNEIVESFPDLSVDPGDSRFVEAIVNGSSRVLTVTIASRATTPAQATTPLNRDTPGDDGVVLGPEDDDFRSALLALFADGAIADRIDLFNLVCVPGLSDAATVLPLQGRCRRRRAFLILDSGRGESVESMAAAGSEVARPDAMNAALYFPWVRAPDPLQRDAERDFPSSGFVAGVFARTDALRGVWKAPAGREAGLNGATGLTLPLTSEENGHLNARGINCLRAWPGYGNVVWGSRTLHGDNRRASDWKYVPVRRLALFLEESLDRGMRWVVFEPNDEPLWAQIRQSIDGFLKNLFLQGAFQGVSPSEAYFVKCDRSTMTQGDIDAGIVNVIVGFAPFKPAEFVILALRRIARQPPE